MLLDVQSETLCHSGTVRRVRLCEVLYLPSLDVPWHGFHTGNDVADQAITFKWIHKPKEVPRLRVVVRIQTVIVPIDPTGAVPCVLSIG